VSRWRPSGTEEGVARVDRGMLLRLVLLLFQPESHGDWTRPRHNPGCSPVEKSAGIKAANALWDR